MLSLRGRMAAVALARVLELDPHSQRRAVHLGAHPAAAQLGVAPGDEAVIRDRIMGDPETGRPTQLATSYIPAGLAAELPVLAARDTGPGGIYDRMEEAGLGPIRWAEAITARPPSPMEASRLGLAPGAALLRIVRVASSPAGRPLEVNDSRMSGDGFEISYPLSRDASALRQT